MLKMADELSVSHTEIPLRSQRSHDLSEDEEKKTVKVRLNSQDSEAHSDGGGDDSDDDEELPFPGFIATSLRCLSQKNKLRYCCLKILTWSYPF